MVGRAKLMSPLMTFPSYTLFCCNSFVSISIKNLKNKEFSSPQPHLKNPASKASTKIEFTDKFNRDRYALLHLCCRDFNSSLLVKVQFISSKNNRSLIES